MEKYSPEPCHRIYPGAGNHGIIVDGIENFDFSD